MKGIMRVVTSGSVILFTQEFNTSLNHSSGHERDEVEAGKNGINGVFNELPI